MRTRRRFANKIVFVGTTALGTREVVATPLDTLFAGVEVHATAADNLLQQDFLSRPEHRVALETQLVIGLGVSGGLLFLRFGLLWGLLATVACGAALGAVVLDAVDERHVPVAALPHHGLQRALAAMTAAGLIVERQRADKSAEENAASQRLMVQTLLSLTGIRDLETGKHSVRTQKYTRVLAQQLSTHPGFPRLPDAGAHRAARQPGAAPRHRQGRRARSVLNKPGALTPEELERCASTRRTAAM